MSAAKMNQINTNEKQKTKKRAVNEKSEKHKVAARIVVDIQSQAHRLMLIPSSDTHYSVTQIHRPRYIVNIEQ